VAVPGTWREVVIKAVWIKARNDRFRQQGHCGWDAERINDRRSYNDEELGGRKVLRMRTKELAQNWNVPDPWDLAHLNRGVGVE
jgi:hypothetical protein